MTQKWLIDQYDSSIEMSESRYTILDDLGVIVSSHTVNGGDPGWELKPDEDMPTLSGADVRSMGLAIMSISMDDSLRS